MIRLVGAALILLGAFWIGGRKTSRFYIQLEQLRQLLHAMELLQCELNYTMYSVPRILHMVSEKFPGAIGEYFEQLSLNIQQGLGREAGARMALEKTKRLCLPNDAVFALLDYSSSLGSFDLDGEDRISKLCCKRISQCLQIMEQEKRPFVKNYIVLALCAGTALVILLI